MKNAGTQPIFTLKDDLEAAEDSAAPCVAEKTEKEVSEASVSTRLKNLFAARKKKFFKRGKSGKRAFGDGRSVGRRAAAA